MVPLRYLPKGVTAAEQSFDSSCFCSTLASRVHEEEESKETNEHGRKHSCDKQTERAPAQQMEKVFGVFFFF